ncbi:MAG: MBL fold metallo-hydrolase [Candidatus Thioglobus sp.]|jgi:sulfur dioxygenase|uniref:MBL fold metallo-hydrolase n=1 Tax=Candidatus Thioglobus sp. TaxID=2026721 RepID=UPI001E11A4F6|nr:MBL fold metallo-hydrolase [Candidatus Thioglobus sp.]MBT3186295.1 MBL fold metallo-hydrolase [Candidatus Thioglobus sp.]MBT3431372.1 MBL fold metallo-hydrolase [Candidatus Thioglobus sp.]MBT3965768.1 MBL fold metallo-hydrolase [Candidatus Thioglobus sp.]MBT4315674.1 MBL fold metallo-hydrolase [Candidatus Thioglobus sp.]MBT4553452.1 MBL fold metallo-hydrolase [Candidatus Thioglobus sp.]
MSLIFKPLFEKESSTYTYLLADSNTKEAIIIDAVDETQQRDIGLIEELGLNLKYIIETHVHADHITSSCPLKQKFVNAQIVLGETNPVACADVLIKDQEVLEFGDYQMTAMTTPGHTDGCMSYVVDDKVFTGDALLIRSCGRCDFQGGSADKLFDSIQKIFTLPDETYVYPAHDYGGRTVSSIWEEKAFNEMIGGGVGKAEFIRRVDAMELSLPAKIHVAVPANQVCGSKIISE